LIDVLTFSGNYPFRKLLYTKLCDVAKLMLEEGFEIIFNARIESLFYRDFMEANKDLLKEVNELSKQQPNSIQIKPLACFNPDYILDRNIINEVSKSFAGVVIAPLYHGFKLSSKKVSRFLRYASELNLPILILGYLEDIREMHRAYRFRYPLKLDDLKTFLQEVKLFGYEKIVLLSFPYQFLVESSNLIANTSIYVDISSHDIYGGVYDHIKNLVNIFGEDHIVFSSKAPLSYPKAVLFKVLYSDISDKAKRKIVGENAKKLFLR